MLECPVMVAPSGAWCSEENVPRKSLGDGFSTMYTTVSQQ